MDYFDAGFNPVISLGGNLARAKALLSKDRKEVTKEFATIFYTEVLKQVFESGSDLFSTGQNENYFGDFKMYNNIFYDKFAKELVKKGGIDNLISTGIISSQDRLPPTVGQIDFLR